MLYNKMGESVVQFMRYDGAGCPIASVTRHETSSSVCRHRQGPSHRQMAVTVRAVPHGGRKPHQRKRPTAECSITAAKRAKRSRIKFVTDGDDDFQ